MPEEQRHGTVFVFRQGSPLDITDLRGVAVSSAAAVIVLADNSRCAFSAEGKRKHSLREERSPGVGGEKGTAWFSLQIFVADTASNG